MQDSIYDHDSSAGEIERIQAPEEYVQGMNIPRILVIGVGGVGCRTVHVVHTGSSKSAVTVAIDTDRPKLEPIRANNRILIGRSKMHGFGCGGGFPEMATEAAERARGTIAPLCAGTGLVVLCAGLGGGTGSGAAPVVARYAKEAGALVVAVVTTPLRVRGNKGQVDRAEHALTELKQIADSVIMFDNNQSLSGRGYQEEILDRWDHLRAEMVTRIEEILILSLQEEPWTLGGFQGVFEKKGIGILMYAETEKEKEWINALCYDCWNNVSADIDPRGGMGACVFVQFDERHVTLQDIADISEGLTYKLDPHARILSGWNATAGMGRRVRVMCLITGIPDCGRPDEVTADWRPPRRMMSSASERIDFIE